MTFDVFEQPHKGRGRPRKTTPPPQDRREAVRAQIIDKLDSYALQCLNDDDRDPAIQADQILRLIDTECLAMLSSVDVPIDKSDSDAVLAMKAHRVWTNVIKAKAELAGKRKGS